MFQNELFDCAGLLGESFPFMVRKGICAKRILERRLVGGFLLEHRATYHHGGMLVKDAVRCSMERRGLYPYTGKNIAALQFYTMFQIGKYIRQLRERPLSPGACSRLLGYLGSSVRRSRYGVWEEVKLYLAKEQLRRLKALLKPSKDHTLV
jgi:hypothetical protein